MSTDTNIDATVKGNKLTITVDLGRVLRESNSGRAMIIAQTAGFQQLNATGLSFVMTVCQSKKGLTHGFGAEAPRGPTVKGRVGRSRAA